MISPEPRKRAKQDRSRRTRQRLLSATAAILVERGYAGTSTPEIAKRAGVSRGALQNLFPTKRGLLAAAVEHLMEKRLAEFSEGLREGMPPVFGHGRDRRIEALLRQLWRIYTGDAFYAWNELCTAARTDEPLRLALARVNADFYTAATSVVSALFADLPEARAIGAVRYITSLMNGLALNRVLDDDDDASEEALALLHKGVRAFLDHQGDLP